MAKTKRKDSAERGRSRVRTRRMGLGGLASSQLMPYLVPWILNLALMGIALVTHWRWHSDAAMIAVLAFGMAGLVLLTHTTWAKRHAATRTLVTLYVAAAGGWLVFATATSPLSHSMLNAWLVGFGFAVAWDLKMAGLSPEDDKTSEPGDPLFSRVRALAGARTKKVKEAPGRVTAKVQLVPGEGTPEQVQAEKNAIASALSMDPNDVTIQSVPGRGDQVKMSFSKGSSLAGPVVWNGPSLPGKSIADGPLVIGMRADGRPIEVWTVGCEGDNPRPLPHTLMCGQTGAGKTDTHVTMVLEARSRRDSVPIVADMSGAFGQGFGLVEPLLGAAVKTPEQVRTLLQNLPDAARYRSELLGSLDRPDGTKGYAQWEPECWTLHRIPQLQLGFEEAADFASRHGEDLDEAIRKFRSTGMALIVSLQVATHSNLERKTRGQFGNALTHGCKEMKDAQFSLNSATLDAGADPTKWQNTSPGSLYAEVVGTPTHEWAVDARAFRLTRETKIKEVNALLETKDEWAVIDQGTYDVLFRGVFDTPDAPPEAPAQAAPEPRGLEPLEPVATLREVDGEMIDITQPIPDAPFGPELPLADESARERLSPAQAEAVFEAEIDRLEAEGTLDLAFPAVKHIQEMTGRGRGWVYGQLNRLTEAGRLAQQDGKPPYRIRPRISNGAR